jgi:hypothetical protein
MNGGNDMEDEFKPGTYLEKVLREYREAELEYERYAGAAGFRSERKFSDEIIIAAALGQKIWETKEDTKFMKTILKERGIEIDKGTDQEAEEHYIEEHAEQ